MRRSSRPGRELAASAWRRRLPSPRRRWMVWLCIAVALERVVHRALEPAHVGVWLSPRG